MEGLAEFARGNPKMPVDWVAGELEWLPCFSALDAATHGTSNPGLGGWIERQDGSIDLDAFRVSNETVISWIPTRWRKELLNDEKLYINILEFLAIIGIVAQHCEKWRKKYVTIWSDNSAATAWANGSAKPREPWRKLARWLVKIQTIHQFRLRIE